MSIGYILLLGIGTALVIEGLLFALAPSRLDQILRMMAEIPVEARRLIGFLAITMGAILISWAVGVGL
ncbi:hypothetical protein roselon_00084 [Roseibacterium elongatum DSM 19469]|uniref:Inner membrane protein YjeT (Clustered with HflC) n=1 Tax=Roseicyclus elongatus DSM 19469 TaxID=1294273 RepID=W8RN52_9RHOB|nr:DUF2065 domain-containing protein [Roseibacterium elongatum]AHM02549.1 hypothetical protein roselon_00084 [Roseibacterium elongatum DSM 19469]